MKEESSSATTESDLKNGIKSRVYSSKPKLTLFQLTILLFTLTSGGPFGIESAVQSGGVFYTLVFLMVIPLVYSLPQSLMCAELGSMMPSHHGYVIWVYRAFENVRFGKFIGFYNAIGEIISLSSDIPIYAVLMSFYFQNLINLNFSYWTDYSFKLFIILLGAVFNIFNITNLGNSAIIFTLMVLLPFFVGFFYNINQINPSNWLNTTPCNDTQEYQWSYFLSTLLWLHTGWDSAGALTSELEFKKQRISIPFFIAMILAYVSYTLPVIGALGNNINCDYNKDDNCWDDGYLYTAYNKLLNPYLGIFIIISGFISNFSTYISEMAVHCRTFWAVSKPYILLLPNGSMYVEDHYRNEYYDDEMNIIDNIFIKNKIKEAAALNLGKVRRIRIGILPQWLCGTKWEKTAAPVRGVVLQSIISAILILFDFQTLLQGTVLINGVTWVFEFVSFLKLRYSEPDAYRPYTVPGGLLVAWIVTVDKLIVVGLLMGLIVIEQPNYFILFGAVTFFVLVWYLVYCWYWDYEDKKFSEKFKHIQDYLSENSVLTLDA